MGVVFLAIRLFVGGYLAWRGVQHLDVYNRSLLTAAARRKNDALSLVAVPLAGLMLTIGAVSLVTGVFPAAGVALIVACLIPSAFLSHAYWRAGDGSTRVEQRRCFWRDVTLALITLALLAVPQPWPLAMFR